MRNGLKTLVFAAAATVVTSLALPGAADADLGHGHGFRYGFRRSYHSDSLRLDFSPGFRRAGSDRTYGDGDRYHRYDGGVLIEVNPKNAREEMEVYVDGSLAGVVNDFDSVFERLRLSPGEHVIEVKLDGYQSLQTTVFVGRGGIYHVRGNLVPVAADAT